MDDGNPFGTPEAEINLAVDVSGYTDRKRAALAAHASQVTDIGTFLAMPDEVFAGFFGTEWYIEPGAEPGLRARLAAGGRLMARLHLVRHGRAAAGWDTDPDPGLDDVGRAQAGALADRLAPLGPLPVLTSPLAALPGDGGAARRPLGDGADGRAASSPRSRRRRAYAMAERVEWLRAAMAGTWSELGERYTAYRDAVVAWIAGTPADAVVVSHFVAINAVIGACLGDDRLVLRSLDNTLGHRRRRGARRAARASSRPATRPTR